MNYRQRTELKELFMEFVWTMGLGAFGIFCVLAVALVCGLYGLLIQHYLPVSEVASWVIAVVSVAVVGYVIRRIL